MDSYFSKYGQLLFEHKFNEAEEYRKNNVPNVLTKFYSLTSDEQLNEKKFETLDKNEIWLSTASEMNDPFEFRGMYIDEEKLSAAGYPQELIDAFKCFMDSFRKEYVLTSFTANSFESLPMWAYYANNSKGFCVEYKVIKPDTFFQVSYEPERIAIASIMANLYNDFSNLSKGKGALTDDTELSGHLLTAQMFMKHKSWAHEQEYRIIYPKDIDKNAGFSVSTELLGLKVKRIICGINCSEKHKERLNAISTKLGCGKMLKAVVSETKYIVLEET